MVEDQSRHVELSHPVRESAESLHIADVEDDERLGDPEDFAGERLDAHEPGPVGGTDDEEGADRHASLDAVEAPDDAGEYFAAGSGHDEALADLEDAEVVLGPPVATTAVASPAAAQDSPTRFQVACMTLPYASFPLERALSGIRSAGYQYVAWGTTHPDKAGVKQPVIAADASPKDSERLAARCKSLGLQPVMMFSGVNFEDSTAVQVYRSRIDQAKAAGIGQIIVFGKTSAGDYSSVIRNLQEAAKHAEGSGVLLALKGASAAEEAAALSADGRWTVRVHSIDAYESPAVVVEVGRARND